MSFETARATNPEVQEQQLSLEQQLTAIDQQLDWQVVPTHEEFTAIAETAEKIKYLGRDEATKEDTYCDENGTPIDGDLAKRVLGAAKPETWVLDDDAAANYGRILAANSPRDLRSGDPKKKSPQELQYAYFTKHLPVSDKENAWTLFRNAAQYRLELSDALIASGAASVKTSADEKTAAAERVKVATEATAKKEAAAKAKKEADDAASKPKNHVVPPAPKVVPKAPKAPEEKEVTTPVVPPVKPPKPAAKTTHPDADNFKDIVSIDSRGRGHRDGGKFIKNQHLEMLMSDDIAAKIRDGAADWEKAKAEGKVDALEAKAAEPAKSAEPATPALAEDPEDMRTYGLSTANVEAIWENPNMTASQKMALFAELEAVHKGQKVTARTGEDNYVVDVDEAWNQAHTEEATREEIREQYGMSSDELKKIIEATPREDRAAKLHELLQAEADRKEAGYVQDKDEAYDQAVEEAGVRDTFGISYKEYRAILDGPGTAAEKMAVLKPLIASATAARAARAAANPDAGRLEADEAWDAAAKEAETRAKYGISQAEYDDIVANSTEDEKNRKLAELETAAAEAKRAAEVAADPVDSITGTSLRARAKRTWARAKRLRHKLATDLYQLSQVRSGADAKEFFKDEANGKRRKIAAVALGVTVVGADRKSVV